MIADRILTQTFVAHERLAPDAQSTLEGIHRRLEERRRPTGGRLAVAGTAGTVVAVAVGASLLLGGEPARQDATPAAPPKPPAAAPPVAAPDFVTLAAGWLPAGTVEQVVVSNSFGHQARGYNVTGADGELTYVLVQTAPGTALPTENKRGVPRDVTVAGRPGREWSVDDWYFLAVRLPQGRIATVDVSGFAESKADRRSAAELATIGRRVAAQLRLDRRERIETSFTLGYVPAGLLVRGVSDDDQAGTSYAIASASSPVDKPARRSVQVVETAQSWGTPQGKPRPAAVTGTPVQGRPTWVYPTEAGPTLWVDEIRPGVSVVLSCTAPGTTLAELYRIADGIRWAG